MGSIISMAGGTAVRKQSKVLGSAWGSSMRGATLKHQGVHKVGLHAAQHHRRDPLSASTTNTHLQAKEVHDYPLTPVVCLDN
eukprot:383172-Pelagomonas_calceolata.AAC.4